MLKYIIIALMGWAAYQHFYNGGIKLFQQTTARSEVLHYEITFPGEFKTQSKSVNIPELGKVNATVHMYKEQGLMCFVKVVDAGDPLELNNSFTFESMLLELESAFRRRFKSPTIEGDYIYRGSVEGYQIQVSDFQISGKDSYITSLFFLQDHMYYEIECLADNQSENKQMVKEVLASFQFI